MNCRICGVQADLRGNQVTCGSMLCVAQNRRMTRQRNKAKQRTKVRERSVVDNKGGAL